MNKIYVDWEDLGLMMRELAESVKKRNIKFDGVYGVPKGGLPLAVVLANRLELPLLLYPTKNSIICDDISDTGKTLNSHKDKFIVTLFSTEWTITKPSIFVEWKHNQDDWIVFPWEEEVNEEELKMKEKEEKQTEVDEFIKGE